MAVPPPQQKLHECSPNIVAMLAFQTDPTALARPLLPLRFTGIHQRYVVVAPTRSLCRGVTSFVSQPRLGAISESVNTNTSYASLSPSTAFVRLVLFSTTSAGGPATTRG